MIPGQQYGWNWTTAEYTIPTCLSFCYIPIIFMNCWPPRWRWYWATCNKEPSYCSLQQSHLYDTKSLTSCLYLFPTNSPYQKTVYLQIKLLISFIATIIFMLWYSHSTAKEEFITSYKHFRPALSTVRSPLVHGALSDLKKRSVRLAFC